MEKKLLLVGIGLSFSLLMEPTLNAFAQTVDTSTDTSSTEYSSSSAKSDTTANSEEHVSSTESTAGTEETADSDNQTPAAPALEAVAVQAAPAAAQNAAVVTSWEQFVTALGNADVTSISVESDLTASNNAVVSGSKQIEFNQHTLDMANRSITLNDTNSATVSNLTLNGSRTGYVFSGTGSLTFQNNLTSAAGNLSNIANMSRGALTFDHVQMTFDNTNDRTTRNSDPATVAKYFTVTNNSQINSNAEKFYGISNSADAGAVIKIDQQSQVTTKSLKGATTNERGQAWDIRRQADFTIDGEGTVLNVEGDGKQQADNGGVFLVQADNSTINITNGAKMNVHSLNTSAILLQSEGGSLNVDNKGELNVTQDGDHGYTLGAAIRFRIKGGMTFNITNQSKVHVEKLSGPTPAIRMYGGDNAINVSGGSDFIVHNVGNGTIRDGGADARNQGILYTSGANNSFQARDEDSNISVTADSGIPFDSKSTDLTVDNSAGTYFVARGSTATSTKGIFNSGQLTFKMDNVKYFDFKNNNHGAIFEANANSVFTNKASDLSVWKKATDLNKSADHTWNSVDYTLQGENLKNLTSTSSADMQGAFGSVTDYSRMSANNQSAIVDELRVPTDADKSIFAHVSMPEGKYDPPRAANDAEASVAIGLFDPNDQLSQKMIATTGTVSIYGEDEKPGWVKATLPNDQFLKEGYHVKVLGAWHGSGTDSDNQPSKAEDIQTGTVKVFGVVPPAPASFLSGNAGSDQQKITGRGIPNTTVHLYLNGADTGLTTAISADANFSIDLPSGLKKGDILQFLLEDKKGAAVGVINPPATNSSVGNIQPQQDLPYHDAVFLKGTTLAVSGDLTLTEVPKSFDFGVQKIQNKTQELWPTIDGQLKVTDSRGNSEGWAVKVAETEPLHSADGKKLEDILVYQDGKKANVLSQNAIVVYEKAKSADGTYVIDEDWGAANQKGIKAVVPVEKQLAGDYSATLNWSLERVPENK